MVAPSRVDRNAITREIDRVFEQVAEAVKDCRIARADRLGAAVFRRADVNGHSEMAMRSHNFLDKRRQRHAVEWLAASRQFREFREDIAATGGLLAQKPDVVAVR